MPNRSLFCLILVLTAAVAAGPNIVFEDYFKDQSLRIDYFHIGNAREETITIDRMCVEPKWPGSTVHLVYPFDYGRYGVHVYSLSDNQLIYSKGFDCMFGEYKTTTPALEGIKRTFQRSLRIPMPLQPILLVIQLRGKDNIPSPIFKQRIDPNDYHIVRETAAEGDQIFTIMSNGDCHSKVDLVFLAEGYRLAEQEKFVKDVNSVIESMFAIEPFKGHRSDFNIHAILRPSPESGVDQPREQEWRKTAFNASFNAFDVDRYLLTEEGIRIQQAAGQTTCDALAILVNHSRYGGGGIFNDYCISTVDNERSKMVFIHEFGHSFGGLADEYYSSEVAYNDFYPQGVEPPEPNITALLDPAKIKWKNLLSPGLAIPTEYGKEKRDSLTMALQKNAAQRREELKAKPESKKVKEQYDRQEQQIRKELEAVKRRYQHLEDKVGVFEGAGYSTKGLYRPMIHCLMIHHPQNQFCLVCQNAIDRMIDYYCGR